VLNVAIVGCGLIGEKRAYAMREAASLKLCLDIDLSKATSFSKKFNCGIATNFNEIISNKDIDIVVISTRHDSLYKFAIEALESGKHVLIEKPGAKNYNQIKELDNAHKKNPTLKLHIGYNHRYHPSLLKALEIYKSGDLGRILYLRGRYGHGGRLGYEKEWRANKDIAGGGELIDQGSHLIDISLAFIEGLELDYASTPTYFWDMEVEDNVFLILKNEQKNIAFLHASWTEWKNMFSFEIYGELGKIEISGLGGSYGPEKLTHHQMLPNLGPPISKKWDFEQIDTSWELEFKEFTADILNNTNYSVNIESSKLILEIIEKSYEYSKI
jgi:predicted dehydrogenase